MFGDHGGLARCELRAGDDLTILASANFRNSPNLHQTFPKFSSNVLPFRQTLSMLTERSLNVCEKFWKCSKFRPLSGKPIHKTTETGEQLGIPEYLTNTSPQFGDYLGNIIFRDYFARCQLNIHVIITPYAICSPNSFLTVGETKLKSADNWRI